MAVRLKPRPRSGLQSWLRERSAQADWCQLLRHYPLISGRLKSHQYQQTCGTRYLGSVLIRVNQLLGKRIAAKSDTSCRISRLRGGFRYPRPEECMTQTPDGQPVTGREMGRPEEGRDSCDGHKNDGIGGATEKAPRLESAPRGSLGGNGLAGTAGAIVSSGPATLAIVITTGGQGLITAIATSVVMMVSAGVAVRVSIATGKTRKRRKK